MMLFQNLVDWKVNEMFCSIVSSIYTQYLVSLEIANVSKMCSIKGDLTGGYDKSKEHQNSLLTWKDVHIIET